jgi:flagellar export protein FliJ
VKRFVFRLQRLLQLRTDTERERARALGLARLLEAARREALDHAQRDFERAGEQAGGEPGSVFRAGELRNLALAVEAAAGRVDEADASHRAAEAEVSEEMERFGLARRERRVLERLREHREQHWVEERGREEQKDIDEVAGRRRPPLEGGRT